MAAASARMAACANKKVCSKLRRERIIRTSSPKSATAGERQGNAAQDGNSGEHKPGRDGFAEEQHAADAGKNRNQQLNDCGACCGERPERGVPQHVSEA